MVDPRVKARVTVISAEPLSEAELYQTFLSVLQVHGFAAVPSGDLIKIVPDVNAKQGPVPAYERDSREGDQLVTQVIKVGKRTGRSGWCRFYGPWYLSRGIWPPMRPPTP